MIDFFIHCLACCAIGWGTGKFVLACRPRKKHVPRLFESTESWDDIQYSRTRPAWAQKPALSGWTHKPTLSEWREAHDQVRPRR